MFKKDINLVVISGRLVADPEVFETEGKKGFARFTIASNDSWKQNGDDVQKTAYLLCKAFNGKVAIVRDYLKKGMAVHVEAKLETEKWSDETGKNQYSTSLVVNELRFNRAKPNNSVGADQSGSIAVALNEPVA